VDLGFLGISNPDELQVMDDDRVSHVGGRDATAVAADDDHLHDLDHGDVDADTQLEREFFFFFFGTAMLAVRTVAHSTSLKEVPPL
jgi:hypothetical protein